MKVTDTPWGYITDRTETGNNMADTRTRTVESDEMDQEGGCCCHCGSGRHKDRSEAEKADLIKRLNRIEGQIRGIRRMVDEDAYCVDILTQVSAASNAMNSFSKELLARHIKGCVAEDIREGHEDKVDELVKTLQRLMK